MEKCNFNSAQVTSGLNSGQALIFTYDATNRLRYATTNGVGYGQYQQDYQYDSYTGNLLSRSDVGTYTYAQSKPHAVSSAGTNTYVYDANGNMTHRTVGNTQWEYTYDAENHLVEVEKDGVTENRYYYDGDGNRVARLGADNTGTVFIGNYYEGVYPHNAIPEPPPPVTEGGGDNDPNAPNAIPQGDITYYYAGSQRIAMSDAWGVHYLLSDHLGSSSVVVNQAGRVEQRGYYLPWGGNRAGRVSITDYGYTGQMREGDIYYYNARWYDPAIGRFMQADTIVPADIQGTQAFDRYGYVNNNPLRYADPSGNRACDDYSGKGCNVIKPPLPWYEVDGVYSFSGSWFMGPPLVGPIPISQETNVYDPVVTGNLPIYYIGSVLDILNSQLGMHIPIIENEVDKNIFWEMTVSVNDKKLNIDSFWIYDGIMGYRKYLTVDIVAHYGIEEGTRSKRVVTLIEDFDPDSIKYCPYRLYFPDGIYFDKPQRLELSMEILCGSCLNGRPKWQGFYQRIR